MNRQLLTPRSADAVEIVRLKIPTGDRVPNNPDHPAAIARDALAARMTTAASAA